MSRFGNRPNLSAPALFSAAALTLQGCATTPDMSVGYYLPKVEVAVKVVQTVGCTKDNFIIAAMTATAATAYSADAAKYVTLPIKRFDGPLSDTTVGFDFYDDGRLKGMNAESTGQGEQIIKSAIALATPLFGIDGGTSTHPDACKKISEWAGDTKTLTLTYEGSVPFDKKGTRSSLEPDSSSKVYVDQLNGALGKICLVTGPSMAMKPVGGQQASPTDGSIPVELRQPASVDLSVEKMAADNCSGTRESLIWQASLQVPQNGEKFIVMVPKPVAFGKQTFNLTLSEAGTITKIGYGKDTGAAQALNAATAVVNAVHQTPAEQTARINDEIGLIAAQRKLVRCLANADDC